MPRILSVVLTASMVGLAVWGVITLYDNNLPVGRMWETPGVKPHEAPIPVMDTRTVPVDGSENFYRLADPATIKAPFDLVRPAVVDAGRAGYGYYCIQCHGAVYDGLGTVGQSFVPPPGDLRSVRVQSMPEGQLFQEISFGVPSGRQPPLASTISVEERWQIIAFVKSLGGRE